MNTIKRYRIKIEEINLDKKKRRWIHKYNICFDTKNIDSVRAWLDFMFYREKEHAWERLVEWINSKQKSFVEKIRDDWDKDLIDWRSNGKDISKREFLENEIFFECLK